MLSLVSYQLWRRRSTFVVRPPHPVHPPPSLRASAFSIFPPTSLSLSSHASPTELLPPSPPSRSGMHRGWRTHSQIEGAAGARHIPAPIAPPAAPCPLPQHRRLGFAIESPPPQISSIAPAATPPATVLLSSRRRRTPLLTSSHRTAVDPFSQAPRSLCPSLPPRSTHGWDVRSPLHLTHPSHGRGHRCSIRIRDCATSARGPCRRILSLHAEL
jgi:hypothetical protein